MPSSSVLLSALPGVFYLRIRHDFSVGLRFVENPMKSTNLRPDKIPVPSPPNLFEFVPSSSVPLSSLPGVFYLRIRHDFSVGLRFVENPMKSTNLRAPPMSCSPTLYSHPNARTVLLFKLVPPPPPYEEFSYLVFTSQGQHGHIS